jgi:predicted nucleic acid-binding protein
MTLVLDASMALAWKLKRLDPVEAGLAEQVLKELDSTRATVPAIWYSEVASGALRAERQGVIKPDQTSYFLHELSEADIVMDERLPHTQQAGVLALARTYALTAYDAAYLELVLRTGGTLATFDRQLAEAVRRAGGRVFGDAA